MRKLRRKMGGPEKKWRSVSLESLKFFFFFFFFENFRFNNGDVPLADGQELAFSPDNQPSGALPDGKFTSQKKN